MRKIHKKELKVTILRLTVLVLLNKNWRKGRITWCEWTKQEMHIKFRLENHTEFSSLET
jgi:hypothetical protein